MLQEGIHGERLILLDSNPRDCSEGIMHVLRLTHGTDLSGHSKKNLLAECMWSFTHAAGRSLAFTEVVLASNTIST